MSIEENGLNKKKYKTTPEEMVLLCSLFKLLHCSCDTTTSTSLFALLSYLTVT